jgi:hypothetical protein
MELDRACDKTPIRSVNDSKADTPYIKASATGNTDFIPR